MTWTTEEYACPLTGCRPAERTNSPVCDVCGAVAVTRCGPYWLCDGCEEAATICFDAECDGKCYDVLRVPSLKAMRAEAGDTADIRPVIVDGAGRPNSAEWLDRRVRYFGGTRFENDGSEPAKGYFGTGVVTSVVPCPGVTLLGVTCDHNGTVTVDADDCTRID